LDKFSKENVFHLGNDHRKFIHSKEELELTKVVKINQICQKSELSIFIHSSATTEGEKFVIRNAVRKTWGSEAIKSNINVFFVIAEPKDDKTQKELESEAFVNKDMIQFGFRDSYYNTTLKHSALLRWAQQNCLHSKYIMKTDDDIIVNIDHLLKNVHKLRNGMTGALFGGTKPIRDVNYPWFVPECLFPDVYYPDYMSGTSYVMTKNIIKPLIETLDEYSGPVFHIDDAFITGVVAEKAGIKRYQSDKFAFNNQCQERTDVCFMFNAFSLVECSSGDNMIEFWNKWRQTTPDSCNFTASSVY
jgi:beta-1,3-galactosyltransferase 1